MISRARHGVWKIVRFSKLVYLHFVTMGVVCMSTLSCGILHLWLNEPLDGEKVKLPNGPSANL
jgi:hypothetical protein